MFLVQLAALGLHRAGIDVLPETEAEWAKVLRGMTPEFPNDEPWCLAVEDWSKPAFLQSPVPAGIILKTEISTPDSLDLLITSRNHDLKQRVASRAEPQDWVLSLISLQTGEGYGGAGNQGIARMNGGSSSRPLIGLAPISQQDGKFTSSRPGSWFRRDVSILMASRDDQVSEQSFRGYGAHGGLGLIWLAPWDEGQQLGLDQLDLWFIEVCRRVRLKLQYGQLCAQSGTSIAPRLSAKHWKGALGDPWAPVHVTEGKGFTLAGRSFDYTTLVDLLFSGDWTIPLLARQSTVDSPTETLALVTEALSRGNSKTEGFKSRILPVGGKITRAISLGPSREKLQELARKQMEEIKQIDKALRDALALAAAGGKRESIRKEYYAHTSFARSSFDRAADEVFFEHLWARFEAQDEGPVRVKSEAERFARVLYQRASVVFEDALPAIPCPSLFRPRAETRARGKFQSAVRFAFPELFPSPITQENNNAVAR
jgi:CRISPR system Cascade subunit CasA